MICALAHGVASITSC